MPHLNFDRSLNRRRLIQQSAAAAFGMLLLPDRLLAMSRMPPGRSIYRLSRQVTVDGVRATEETAITAIFNEDPHLSRESISMGGNLRSVGARRTLGVAAKVPGQWVSRSRSRSTSPVNVSPVDAPRANAPSLRPSATR